MTGPPVKGSRHLHTWPAEVVEATDRVRRLGVAALLARVQGDDAALPQLGVERSRAIAELENRKVLALCEDGLAECSG